MNDLTKVQLELIGIKDNEIWHKHKNDHGYIDGESFETFFHRKHGYASDKHIFESNKRNLTQEERILDFDKQLQGLAEKVNKIEVSREKNFIVMENNFKNIKADLVDIFESLQKKSSQKLLSALK